MKNEITVVLSGEGADELFGGYGRIFRSPHDYYKQKLFNGKHKTMVDHFLSRYSWFTEKDKEFMLNKDLISNGMFDEYSLNYIKNLFSKFHDNDYYRAMYYIQGKLHLPNLLNRLDRMTMAASIEARVPFLDIELVDLVSTMPIHYKLRWNNYLSKLKSIFLNSEVISEKYDTPKYILKKLMNNKIPSEIINRKKMGFPVPLDNWFNNSLRDIAFSTILDSNSYVKNIINIKNIESLLNKKTYESKYDYFGKKIWMLINLELWMKKYF
jgi:asparagine synthase (glutamine-hydrolysing)